MCIMISKPARLTKAVVGGGSLGVQRWPPTPTMNGIKNMNPKDKATALANTLISNTSFKFVVEAVGAIIRPGLDVTKFTRSLFVVCEPKSP